MENDYDIRKIAKSLALGEEEMLPFGYDKAKIIPEKVLARPRKGKIILCTALTPTKAGEGKTTTAIGLADGLKRIGVETLACLREPSLGPVFGVKGGGAGGGEATLYPLDDINLHFTGDIHAITSVNNLLVALIDNEVYQHSDLDVDPERIVFPRAMDMNDRSLRSITVAENDKKAPAHHSSFVITAASEIMAIFCLSRNEEDFLDRVDNVTLAYNRKGQPIFARDLHVRNAVRYLIHTALYPNLVQTKYHTPALVHGGPFANIAHGTNTLIATDLALRLADVVVTEGGFGSDLGMEKYLDIVSPKLSAHPSLVVMVASVRALKLHGGVKFIDLDESNVDALKKGFSNLKKHLENVKLYHLPVLVSINRFPKDHEEEIQALEELLKASGFRYCLNTSYQDGPKGALSLAKEAQAMLESEDSSHFAPIVTDLMSAKEKIETIARKIYGSKDVLYAPLAESELEEASQNGYGDYDVCISKTPNSLSDDPHKLNVPLGESLHVRSVRLFTGAKFLVPLTGDVFTMPGLPKVPAAKDMKGTQR